MPDCPKCKTNVNVQQCFYSFAPSSLALDDVMLIRFKSPDYICNNCGTEIFIGTKQ